MTCVTVSAPNEGGLRPFFWARRSERQSTGRILLETEARETREKIEKKLKIVIFRERERVMVEIDADGLAKQNKDTVDLTTLAADTPEVISRQVRLSFKFLIN